MPQPSRMAPLDVKPFLRTFSYREVLSALMIAALLLATVHTLGYLDIHFGNLVVGLSSFLVVVFLHVLYRLEHKRSNNFAGRIIHDSLYLIVLYLINLVITFYNSGEGILNFGFTIASIFAFWIIFMMIEGLVALLIRLFDFLGWRVL